MSVYRHCASVHSHSGHTCTPPHMPSGCHTWAHISAHLSLQLKDFSIVLLLQALVFDLQVDQLLADLGLVRVSWLLGVGGLEVPLWRPEGGHPASRTGELGPSLGGLGGADQADGAPWRALGRRES